MSKLTWKEAQQAMRKGKRVRNVHFTSDEWFEWRDGAVRCEMGYDMTRWYRGEAWQDEGWSVIE